MKELGVLGWETTYSGFVRPENRVAYLAGPFWSLERLEEIIADAACLVVVSEDGAGSVSGFLSAEPIDGNRVELTRFYVDPSVRRSGVGGLLFAEALDWAVASGAGSMLVNVFADNHDGRRFYERSGFTLLELVPTTVGDQVVGDAWYELVLRSEFRVPSSVVRVRD